MRRVDLILWLDLILWRTIRALLRLTPLWRRWSLDHSPSLSVLGRCPCRDCAEVRAS